MKYFSLYAAIFATLANQACSDMTEKRKLDSNTFRIGVLMDSETSGINSRNAARLAAKEINAQGGINGQKVELVFASHITADTSWAAPSAQDLVDDKVQAVLGADTSGNTIEAAEKVLIAAGIPIVSPAATSPQITELEDSGLVWRTVPSDAYQGEYLANVMKAQGINKVGGIYINDSSYSKGLFDRFKQVFTAGGGTVSQEVSYTENDAGDPAYDWNKVFKDAIAGLADGDAVINFGYGQDTAFIARSLETTPNVPKLTFWAGDAVQGNDILKGAPESYLRKVKGTIFASPSGTEVDTFGATFKAGTGDEIDPYTTRAYDAIYLIAFAALKGGANTSVAVKDNLLAVSGPKSGTTVDISPVRFAEAKEAIAAGKDVNFVGITGDTDFDSKGDTAIDAANLTDVYDIWSINPSLDGYIFE